MIINDKILSIPPYVSTTWKQISSLHQNENKALIITLRTGVSIEIPSLPDEVISAIFFLHAEHAQIEKAPLLPTASDGFTALSFPLSIDAGLLEMTSTFLQHDPSKMDAQAIPQELVDKLQLIARKLGPIDEEKMPQAEPHCHCPHCQIVRAIRSAHNHSNEEVLEEEVAEADLRFKEWDIAEIRKDTYSVTNPLDKAEEYTVYLGNPIGCTCGDSHCEHIKAVLQS